MGFSVLEWYADTSRTQAFRLHAIHYKYEGGLLVYSFLCLAGAEIVARLDPARRGNPSGWVILVMMSWVIACMATEHGGWKKWMRICFVPFAWIAEGIISFPITILTLKIGLRYDISDVMNLGDRLIVFGSSLPIVMYAMLHSTMFAERAPKRTAAS